MAGFNENAVRLQSVEDPSHRLRQSDEQEVSSAEEAVDLHVEEWTYRGEGSANIVLAYDGESSQLVGKVLRLAKALHHPEGPEEEAARKAGLKRNPRNKKLKLSAEEKILWGQWPAVVGGEKAVHVLHAYASQVMRPLLGDFVQPGIYVGVSHQFLESLADSIRPSRPPWRVEESDVDCSETSALIIPDNTTLPRPTSAPRLSPTFCVEIKPKCGFCPSSAAISPAHAAKLSTSRFQLHQQLKLAHGEVFELSEYDPLELYSGDTSRMLHALMALTRTPQNNLRVFQNGQQIYGGHIQKSSGVKAGVGELSGGEAGSTGSSKQQTQSCSSKSELSSSQQAALEEVERQLQELIPLPVEHRLEGLWHVVVKCLKQSQVMDKLLAVQRLDSLDVEGAIHAFNRIVPNGSLLELDPSTWHKSHPSAAELMAECQALSDRTKFLQRIQEASIEECAHIVRDFLISATAKDCGLMIALERVDPHETLEHGVSRLFVDEVNATYAYKIALIDLDLKSLKKFPKYFSLDQEIIGFHAAASK